jgi:glutathione S-transferase
MAPAAITFTIPKEYGYILATATGSFILSTWHAMRVGPFRKAAKIPYPNNYASTEQIEACNDADRKQAMYLFNCAQRAHYNFLENYVGFLPALLIAGLAFPRGAAVTGAVWTVFRYFYAVGYTKKDQTNGRGRMMGSGFWLAQFTLFGMVGKMAYDALMMG